VEAPELSVELLVLGGLAIAIASLLLGWALGRGTSASGQKYREVERELDQVLQNKKAYEDEVVEHFSETARLLNNLTESYRDVHNHLAKGANTLCQGKGPVSLEHLDESADPAEIPSQLASVRPPLDYAPKTSPDEKGMLNEEFGLERNKRAEAPEDPAKS
jgi:uncharacterized membrane-anchored protein YhcB (DUF1043 family)